MSLRSAPDCCHTSALHFYRRSESGDDDERRLKRREKNRVAAQRSRKRQTQRADELHEMDMNESVSNQAYECLEQQNSLLKKEVQLLLEEQRSLAEALKVHEPLCPVLNSSILPSPRPTDGTPS